MSKRFKTIFCATFVLAQILHFFNISSAQTLQIGLKIADSKVFIDSKFLDGKSAQNVTNFSLPDSYAGQENLARRFADLELRDANERKIAFRKLTDGEFLAESAYSAWSYTVNAKPLNLTAMAHVSWLAEDQGILMLNDLLPQMAEKTSAHINFEIPAGWQIVSSEKKIGANLFETNDAEKAVFYVGKNHRELDLPNRNPKFSISGEFLFNDSKAVEMASEIFSGYENLFGEKFSQPAQILLVRYPKEAKFGRWQAETRGANIVILSADMPFSTQSEQKLHEQLRHEVFHLWIPNGLNLSGNYDWFYEGFALYQALRSGVAVNRIRFEDFLDTLARAFDIDTMASRRQTLIEASKNRWNGANTSIYARGMLTAFLIDLALLHKSKGRKSLSDIFREIYQKHHAGAVRQDGNTAVLSILEARPELRPTIQKYVRGAENIVWQTDLESFGIEAVTENFSTKLKVKAKPDGRQKDLLDKLGYNNWRNFLKNRN